MKSTLRKLGLLTTLYFAQGLPFGFFTQAVPVMLRKESFSLGQIGLSSLLAAPWALKFLWAPLVDRKFDARVGRRKSWILPLQLAAVLILIALAFTGARPIGLLLTAVFLLNLVAATQDIATDGLAVELTTHGERGLANGVQVAGYRVGMVVGGGALLIFYDRLGPATTFSMMAALIVLSTLPIALFREPSAPLSSRLETGPDATPEGGARDVQDGAPTASRVPHFLRRPGAGQLILLVVLYKFGDAFATAMLRPFLVDRGLSLADIGWLLGTVGFVAGLVGALLGGALLARLSRRAALVTFGLLQAGSIAGYALAAAGKAGLGMLYVFCALEHVTSGMATAALFTCMMDWCSRQSSATDYTVQASSVVIATGVASMFSGVSAQLLGYFAHFTLATAVALAAVLLAALKFPPKELVGRVTLETA